MKKTNLKKVLGSIFTIGIVAIVAVFVTQAFFSDTETSVGNTFVAGAIDLKIDNTSYGFDWNDPDVTEPTGEWGLNSNNSWQSTDLTDEVFFSFTDLKPGDYGEDTISLEVNNNDAYACMAFDLTETPENTWTAPEQEFGDPGTENGDDGELQKYLSFLFWYDDGDNVLEEGEQVIPELSGLPGSAFTGGWLPIAEGGDDPLPANETTFIGKGWCFGEMTATPVAQGSDAPPDAATNRIGFTCNGEGDHNDAQTDGIVVDVAFHAVQSRNNENFLCSSLENDVTPTPGDEEEPLEGFGIVQSSLLNYGDGGYAGWSTPVDTVVLGGGFNLPGGPAAVSAPGQPGDVWPHYTFPAGEYGWVVADASDGAGSTGSSIYAIYATEPAGYEIVTSSDMAFGDGGYGGWSCPAGKVILGGGFEATAPVAVSAPGLPGVAWPHYTFGGSEYGWVVQDAPDGAGNTIKVYSVCADMPDGHEVVNSPAMAFSDTGYGGWSCPAGKVVTGGGFDSTGTVSVSAPGVPSSVWPHYTFGGSEYGWVVQDAPDGAGNTTTVYAVCANEL